jgi:hypothetical protein
MGGYLATAAWGRFGREAETGEPLSVEAPASIDGESNLEIRGPDGSAGLVELDAQSTPPRLRSRAARQPGLYTFMVEGEPWAQLAVNPPRSESLRKFLEADEFRSLVFGPDTRGVRGIEGEDVSEAITRARSGRPIHRLFFLLAGIFLVAESLLGRRVAIVPER